MSFVEKPPYYSNPFGKIGLLSSMYALKAYRRKGIGKTILEKVIQEAKEYGCSIIQITAQSFEHAYKLAEKKSKINETSYYNCYDQLVEWKFIRFNTLRVRLF